MKKLSVNKDTEELNSKLCKKEQERSIKAQNRRNKKENKRQEKLDKKKLIGTYKLKKLEVKQRYSKDKDSISCSTKRFHLYNFFTKWFYIGVALVLISICLSLYNSTIEGDMTLIKIILQIISGLFSTIGVALFVGCIFDFSKNSEAFVNFVSKILKDIVISKNFLTSLAANDKKEALKLILQPSDKQIEKYSNINEYFKKKIDDYMKMFDNSFKTNLSLEIEARKNNNRVVCYSILTYTVYKIGDEFQPIKVSFEKDGSTSDELIIIHEKGETPINKENTKQSTETNGCLEQTTFECAIPDELQIYDRLTIRRKMYEPGEDHWMNYNWQSLTPYEGINCHLKCFDGLTVKDFLIYDNKAFYHTELSKDRMSLHITSSQWLEADTGFYITISDTENMD